MSMPRAAMSVATSTCSLPLLNSASARVRAVWLLLPWIASAGMPSLASCSARRLAPCLVRVNTSTWCQSLVLDQVGEQLALAVAGRTGWTTCVDELGGGVAARDLDQRRVVQEAVGERADLVGEGRREQQVLALLGQQREDALRMSRMKPMSSMRSASSSTRISTCDRSTVLLLHVVEQAARRGDQDVDAACAARRSAG